MVTVIESELAGRVRAFLEPYRGAFRRRDQARWAALYIQGLLAAEGRRTIEGIARSLGAGGLEDIAQGLGHFVTASPWDENELWRRFHASLRGHDGTLVVDEVVLPKQGRHSVGAFRQHSRALGRKVSCQLAVLLHHVGPAGAVPLALRLYLPRAWRQDADALRRAGVPEREHAPLGRADVAFALIDEALAAGLRADGVGAGLGWEWPEDVAPALAARGLGIRPVPEGGGLAGARADLERLGLGHFEGRSWRGFHHHACLVTLARAV